MVDDVTNKGLRKVVSSFSVDPDELVVIKTAARLLGVSVSELISRSVLEYVNDKLTGVELVEA